MRAAIQLSSFDLQIHIWVPGFTSPDLICSSISFPVMIFSVGMLLKVPFMRGFGPEKTFFSSSSVEDITSWSSGVTRCLRSGQHRSYRYFRRKFSSSVKYPTIPAFSQSWQARPFLKPASELISFIWFQNRFARITLHFFFPVALSFALSFAPRGRK